MATPCPKLFIPRKNWVQATMAEIVAITDIPAKAKPLVMAAVQAGLRDELANYLAIERWANNFPCGGTGGLHYSTVKVQATDSLSHDTDSTVFTCTGTHDEATIQAAINALPPEGGRVLLMEGTYNVDCSNSGTEIVLRSNCTIEGQGAGTVVRQVAGKSFSSTPIFRASLLPGPVVTANVRIANLVLDGNDSYSGATTLSGADFDNTNNVIFENVIFTRFGAYGLRGADACFDWAVRSCLFTQCGDFGTPNTAGILLDKLSRAAINGCLFGTCHVGVLNEAQHIEISDCVANACNVGFYYADGSLRGRGTANVSNYTNCDAIASSGDGFVVSGPVNECNFTGCTAEASAGNGFQITNIVSSTLSGCQASQNGQHGFLLQSNNGGQDSSLIGCSALSNGQNAANTYDGFNIGGALSGSISDFMVQACTSRGASQRYGANITPKSSGLICINNDFHASGTTGNFIDSGVGTLLNLDGSANDWNRVT